MNPLNRNDDDHQHWMREALREAAKAAERDEVPVGCVIVHEGRVVGRGHNQTEMLRDATAHAEMLALTQAAEALGGWRLTGCTLYCTIEPCTMCCGAMVLSRVTRLVYGAADPKFGAVVSIADVLNNPRHNHKVQVIGGVCADEAAQIMKTFFQARRNKKEPD
ncbi:MAG: tRNA adenosine(34) deaminase TadA [Verrucomicrobia bacterium]|nr:tRNA adenosine(34) deaminase TadA [Verrucomicrobiota bacterium]